MESGVDDGGGGERWCPVGTRAARRCRCGTSGQEGGTRVIDGAGNYSSGDSGEVVPVVARVVLVAGAVRQGIPECCQWCRQCRRQWHGGGAAECWWCRLSTKGLR